MRVDPAYGCNQIASRNGFALHRADPLSRSRQRVVAKIHRRRTRMIGVSLEANIETALPRNRRNYTQREIQTFQHWTLLNVKFKIADGWAGDAGIGDLRGSSP